MMRATCPACGRSRSDWSASEWYAHRSACGRTRPAWIARVDDPAATRHPRGWVRGGVQ